MRFIRNAVIAAALGIVPGAAVAAQSPVAFPKEVYAARRDKLSAQVAGSAIIVPGRYLVGVRDIGHHVGLDATDGRDWTVPLAAGMVVTIEPKIYIPGMQIAIMIEDMILVTSGGSENLSTAAPKRAVDIERVMASVRRR